jgi:hypothetical protein
MENSSCVRFDNIAQAAYLIDQEFDYNNDFSIGIENNIRAQYGDTFYDSFSEYFSNCWYEVLGEAIMSFDFAEVFSMAVRHAAKTANVDLADTGNWDGEELED